VIYGGIYHEVSDQFPSVATEAKEIDMWSDWGLTGVDEFKKIKTACLVAQGTRRRFHLHVGQHIELRGTVYPFTPVRKGHSHFQIWLRCSTSQERNRSCTGGDNCNTIWTKCSVSKISKRPPAYTIICVRWVRSCSKASDLRVFSAKRTTLYVLANR